MTGTRGVRVFGQDHRLEWNWLEGLAEGGLLLYHGDHEDDPQGHLASQNIR